MIPTSWTAALNSLWTRAVAVAVLVALIGLAGGQVHHEDTNPLVRTVLLAQPPSAVAVDPRLVRPPDPKSEADLPQDCKLSSIL